MKVIEGNTYYINSSFYERVGEQVEVRNINTKTGMADFIFKDGKVKKIHTGYLQREPEKLKTELNRDIELFKRGEKKTDVFIIDDSYESSKQAVNNRYTKILSIIAGRVGIALCVDATGLVYGVNIDYFTNLTDRDIKRLTRPYITY